MSKEVYESNEEGLALSKQICLELLLIVDQICKENNLTYWIDGGTLLAAKRHQGFIPWDDDIDICLLYHEYEKLIELLVDYCNKSEDYILFHSKTKMHYCYDFFGKINYLRNGITPVRIDINPVKVIKNDPRSIKIDQSLYNILSLYFQGFSKDETKILEEHKHFLPNKTRDLVDDKNKFINFYIDYMKRYELPTENKSEFLLTYIYNDAKVKQKREYYEVTEVFPISTISFEKHTLPCPNDTHNYLVKLYGTSYLTPPPEDQRLSHFTKLYKSSIPKEKIKYLLNKFYYYGFLNFNLPDYKNQKRKKQLMIINFFKLSGILILKLEFNLLKAFLRYVNFKRKR